MTAPTLDRPRTAIRAVRLSVLALAALVVLKFVALLAEYDWQPEKAPWALLVLVALPTGVITWLSRRRPRAAAAVAAPLLALWCAVVVLALVRDGVVRQSWADYPAAYGGLLLAAWGVTSAVRVLRDR